MLLGLDSDLVAFRRHNRSLDVRSTAEPDDHPVERDPWALRNSHWIVFVGGVFASLAGIGAVVVLPTIDELVGDFVGGDLQSARADLRRSGLAVAAGIGVATAGLLTWGRLELSRRQHALDRRRQEHLERTQLEQHALAQQSQRNERFAKAIELLGHTDRSVRTGALYALDGLARDGHARQDVCDVVCAFARTHTTQDERELDAIVSSGDAAEMVPLLEDNLSDRTVSAEQLHLDDYEAALTIALRWPLDWSLSLDLTGTTITDRLFQDLQNCSFEKARFVRCNFDGLSLVKCRFDLAVMISCRMYRATLTRCSFNGTRIEDCNFNRTTLIEVDLEVAEIIDTTFDGVDDQTSPVAVLRVDAPVPSDEHGEVSSL